MMANETAHQSYVPFIILTAPRSGSNYLSYLLHSHPHCVSIGEPFCIETIWGSPAKPQFDGNAVLKLLRDVIPVFFLRRLIYGAYPSHIQSVGFRIFYHHLERFTEIEKALVHDRNVRVIHLKRKNILANLASLYLARKTGQWSSLSAASGNRKETVVIPYEECLSHFRYIDDTALLSDRLFADHEILSVYYENLIAHRERESKRIQQFLEMSYRPLSCDLVKQSVQPLSSVIENYWVLKKRFVHTKWHTFFEDV